MLIDRRALLAGSAALLAAPGAASAGVAPARPAAVPNADIPIADIPIADMHAHLFFIGPKPAALQPLRRNMAGGGASLVAWSLVGDMPWIRPSAGGLKQVGTPKAGGATQWLQDELGRIDKHLAEQDLKVVRGPKDLDHALAGEPHVVLAVEGASFLDEGIAGLERAHAAGIRHLQLVHYVRNTIGDFQTEAPVHGGLTDFGRDVIREANRLGILVDLAHLTSAGVRQALEVSRMPMVWSHSSITQGAPHWNMQPRRARQLGLDDARAIAAKGGVVGLWALRSDVGSTIEAYADRMLDMAGLIGDDHVGFGTDMNALAATPISSYANLRRAVEHMAARGADRGRLEKIAIGNYVRVLRQAMAPDNG